MFIVQLAGVFSLFNVFSRGLAAVALTSVSNARRKAEYITLKRHQFAHCMSDS
jgi:hypothetical protein